jgi:hypothetical protein
MHASEQDFWQAGTRPSAFAFNVVDVQSATRGELLSWQAIMVWMFKMQQEAKYKDDGLV